jgi:5-hydroxyisourate hydrolase
LSTVTTHVLDTTQGAPAAAVSVVLEHLAADAAMAAPVGSAQTDLDGRAGPLGVERLEPGHYRLRFDTGRYFAAAGQPSFYPEVVITFTIADEDEHYHVPLLLSPFGYSTYRGS